MSLEKKLKEKAFIVSYATGRKSVFNSACPELEQSKPLLKVDDVLEELGEVADEIRQRKGLAKFEGDSLISKKWVLGLLVEEKEQTK